MKRRLFIQTLATVPAAATATALGQQPAAPPAVPTPQGGGRGGGPGAGAPPAPDPLTYAVPDDTADPVLTFFLPAQIAALRTLGGIFVPDTAEAPGAVKCRAAEFLDFLLSESPAQRQQLYRAGLDGLNSQARRRFSRGFSETSAEESFALLEPMRRPWSYEPKDPVEKFLRTAHRDLRTATQNSREFAVATGNIRTVRKLRPLD